MPTQLERPDNTLVEDYIYSNYNYIIFPMPSTKKKKSIEWILTLFKQEKYNELGCHLIVQIGLWKWKMKWMKNIHGQASIHPSIFSCRFFYFFSSCTFIFQILLTFTCNLCASSPKIILHRHLSVYHPRGHGNMPICRLSTWMQLSGRLQRLPPKK